RVGAAPRGAPASVAARADRRPGWPRAAPGGAGARRGAAAPPAVHRRRVVCGARASRARARWRPLDAARARHRAAAPRDRAGDARARLVGVCAGGGGGPRRGAAGARRAARARVRRTRGRPGAARLPHRDAPPGRHRFPGGPGALRPAGPPGLAVLLAPACAERAAALALRACRTVTLHPGGIAFREGRGLFVPWERLRVTPTPRGLRIEHDGGGAGLIPLWLPNFWAAAAVIQLRAQVGPDCPAEVHFRLRLAGGGLAVVGEFDAPS